MSLIQISLRSGGPIYQQLKEEVIRLACEGILAPDEQLPSVRSLAAELAINPNTIQRAYRELEIEGYIYSVAGKGSFVGMRNEVDESRKAELIARLTAAARELRYLGMTDEELIACLGEGGKETK